MRNFRAAISIPARREPERRETFVAALPLVKAIGGNQTALPVVRLVASVTGHDARLASRGTGGFANRPPQSNWPWCPAAILNAHQSKKVKE
jgi:hypothetical protein